MLAIQFVFMKYFQCNVSHEDVVKKKKGTGKRKVATKYSLLVEY